MKPRLLKSGPVAGSRSPHIEQIEQTEQKFETQNPKSLVILAWCLHDLFCLGALDLHQIRM